VYWDKEITANKGIPGNIPDILFVNKEIKETYIAIPDSPNIMKEYFTDKVERNCHFSASGRNC
jgi:hypothetical protein